MNPTTESVTAEGVLHNHSRVRPQHAMNNIATGDIHVGTFTCTITVSQL